MDEWDAEEVVGFTVEVDESCANSDTVTVVCDESWAEEEESTRFGSPWHHSDVVLIIEEKKFYVHKCILSMCSLVFEKMFTSDFKEKSAAEIPLPGKSAEEFEVLLQVVYSDDKPSMIDYDNFEFLLKLADEYQMTKIKKICIDYMKSNINEESCLHFRQVADQFDLEDALVQSCVDEAKWLPLSTIESSSHFDQISSMASKQILVEKIKVLEECKEVLDSYYQTCHGLIRSIYGSAASIPGNKFTKFVCYTICHYEEWTRNRFVFDCEKCISRLERHWPSSVSPFREVESTVKKLRSLAIDYQNAQKN